MHEILVTFSGVSCPCGFRVNTLTGREARWLGDIHANEHPGDSVIEDRRLEVADINLSSDTESEEVYFNRRFLRHDSLSNEEN